MDSDDSEARAAKRRRIEKLGEQYLRGDGLFIMSASLKGPLTGWRNPWLKKGKKKARSAAAQKMRARHGGVEQAEIPETTYKDRRGGFKELVSEDVKTNSGDRVFTPQAARNEQAGEAGRKWLKKDTEKTKYSVSMRDESPTPVNRYLHHRKLDNAMPSNVTSPSSKVREAQPSTCATLQPSSIRGATPSRSEILSAATATALPQPSTKISKPVDNDRSVILRTSPAKPTLGVTRPRAERRFIHTAPPSTRLPEFECRPVARTSGLDTLSSREEQQIYQPESTTSRQARRVDVASSADPPAAMTKKPSDEQALEPCRQQRRNTDDPHEAALTVVTEPAPAEQFDKPVSASVGRKLAPSLSTQTSNTTTTNMMPSAQAVPAMPAPPVDSNSSNAGKMIETGTGATLLDEGHYQLVAGNTAPSKTGNLAQTELKPHKRPSSPHLDGAEPSKRTRRSPSDRIQLITPFSAFRSPVAEKVANQLDTQEMLAAITPLGFSTIRKAPLKSANNETPATATRLKSKDARKRASFAPTGDAMSSGGPYLSIKSNLKVSKSMPKPANKAGDFDLEGKRLSAYGKLGLDMETSDEEVGDERSRVSESLPDLSSLLQAGKNQPETPGHQNAFPPPPPIHPATSNTVTSTTTGEQQDAQQAVADAGEEAGGQHGLEGQSGFDLSSAMDDLGSFLGTPWSAEKEARGLESVRGSRGSSARVKSAMKRGSMTGVYK